MSTIPPDGDLPGFEPDDPNPRGEASSEPSGNTIDEKLKQIDESLDSWQLTDPEHFESDRWWRSLGRGKTGLLPKGWLWRKLYPDQKDSVRKDVESGRSLTDAWKKLLAGIVVVTSVAGGCAFYNHRVVRSSTEPAPAAESLELQEMTGPEVGAVELADEFDDVRSAVERDDLEAVIGSPVFLKCPPGFQQDVLGKYLSGDDEATQEEPAATADDKAANTICGRFDYRSYVFTMIVEGDGETLSTQPNTFYEVSFVVNNEWPDNYFYDDTGFLVFATWNHLAEQWAVTVSDSLFSRITDFGAEVQWLDQSTLEVHITIPGHDVVVNEVRTELHVFAGDDAGKVIYSRRDIADWHADSAEG